METMEITANQLRAGDYILTGYENGKRPAWIGVGSVSVNQDGSIIAYGAMTSYDYPAGATITIEAR